MSIEIREATLDSDEPTLTQLIKRYLAPGSNDRRFNWLYCSGPHGAARAWLACDLQDGNTVGMGAAFPRKVYFNGNQKLAWVFGDFCMTENYRSLGPALALQRRCLEKADSAPVDICYDFPSQTMVAIYRRLGIQQTATLVRWAKPLRAEVRLEAAIGSKAIARQLSILPNAALAMRGWKGEKNVCELQLHEGRCSAEFTELDSKLGEQAVVRTVRSAEYLNWRYLDHPESRYEILTARRGGVLIGYTVFSQDLEYATVADLCSWEEPPVIARLLAGVVDIVRERNVITLNLYAGNSHPWCWIFEKAGFHRREAAPVIVSDPKGAVAMNSGSILRGI